MIENIRNENMGYKDIFNVTFAIYLKNFKWIAILSVFVSISVNLLRSLFGIDELFNEIYTMDLNNVNMQPLVLIFLFMGIYMAVFNPIITGGVSKLAQASIEKGESGFGDLMAGSLEVIFKHIVTAFLYYAIINVGAVLFFVPSVYFGILFIFSTSAVAITGRWGFGAFRESAMVVRGRWLQTIGLLLLISAFGFAVTYIYMFVLLLIPAGEALYPISLILSFIFDIFMAYLTMVIPVWFLNKRYMNNRQKPEALL